MRLGPLGIWEILAIVLIVLLVFGAKRLPAMAKGVGQSVNEFRKGMRDIKDDITSDDVASDEPTVSRTKAQASGSASGTPEKAKAA